MDTQLVNGESVHTVHTDSDVNLYPLDQTEFRVEIETKRGTCIHWLRKPTLEQLIAREAATISEREAYAPGEYTFTIDDEKANAALWDKIALRVKGYRTSSFTADQEIEVTPEIAAKIPSDHKLTAILGNYALSSTLEETEEEGFNLDGEIYVIKQEIGVGETPAYTIHHTLRQPTEGERQTYKRKSVQTVLIGGSRKDKAKLITNLRAATELYDNLFISIDGVSGASDPKKQVDPLWKRSAIQALMNAFEAGLSD
jgi:hypothetical protein